MRSDERTLLDLLCLAAPMSAELDRVFRLRGSWGQAVQSLRNRGLVAFDSLLPSPSALAAFADRRGELPTETGETPHLRVVEAAAPVAPIAVPAPGPAGWRSTFLSAYGRTGRIDAALALTAVMASEAERALPQAAFRPRAAKAPEWSEAEDDRLRQAYADGERVDLVAEELGRTVRGAMSRAQKLGLAGRHAAGRGGWATEPDWTEAEDEQIRRHYPTMRAKDLAALLHRSQRALYSRAFVLGVKNGWSCGWSDDERRAAAIAHRRGVSLSDLALALGRNYPAVAKFCENNCLSFERQRRLAVAPTLALILSLEDPAVPLPATVARARPTNVRQPELWTPEKRTTFLGALRSSGRLADALVAAGLGEGSRKAAYRQKHRDAAFSAAWDEALRASPYKPGRRSMWGQPERQEAFVAALRKTGQITRALAQLGFGRGNHTRVVAQRTADPDFAQRCDDAIAAWKAEQPLKSPPPLPARAAPRPAPKPRQVAPPPSPPPPPPPAVRSVQEQHQPPQRRQIGSIRSRAGDWAGFNCRQDQPPAPKRYKTDAEISAENLRYIEERKRIDVCGRRDLSVEEAKLVLQRKGLAVFRSNVTGGRADRWSVAGMGNEVTDQQLIERAERASA